MHKRTTTMKILLDARAMDVLPYGVGRNASEMVDRLPRLMPSWQWIILRRGERPPVKKRQVTTIFTPVGLFQYPLEQQMLEEVLRAQQPDLSHSLWFPVPEQSPCPRVLTVYDAILEKGWPEFQTSWNLKMRFWQRRNIAHAEHLIAISAYAKTDIQTCYGLRHKEISVVHLGAGKAFKQVKKKDLQRVRSAWQLPNVYLFCSAHDDKSYKNVAIVREALKQVRKATGRTPCVVSAGGKRKERGAWKELGFISDTDLASVMTGAVAAIDPSRDEGFGLPVLEAMTCGVPVISSNAASLPEVGGDAVRYFDPGSVNELAGAIIEIMADPARRRRMRAAGISQARRFSWEQAAEQTLAVYKKVLKQKSPPLALPIDWRLVAVSESLPDQPFSKKTAPAYLAYAHTLQAAGQHRQAIETFTRIADRGRLDPDALFALATAHMDSGDETSAVPLLLKLRRRTLRDNPDGGLHRSAESALNACANTFREQGLRFKALEQWEQAILSFQLMRQCAQGIDAVDHLRSAWFHLGECALRLHQYKTAIRHLQACLRVCPDHRAAPALLKEARNNAKQRTTK
ncbi:MAG: glycosyltransferase [Spartobacteria bacterium]|nr:glycosyltransferase [Spartobacteria bacterium]